MTYLADEVHTNHVHGCIVTPVPQKTLPAGVSPLYQSTINTLPHKLVNAELHSGPIVAHDQLLVRGRFVTMGTECRAVHGPNHLLTKRDWHIATRRIISFLGVGCLSDSEQDSI